MGGGTISSAAMALSATGLSPRGRGNLNLLHDFWASHRSIPAWAGEPGKAASAVCVARVYPRVGGGTDVSVVPSRKIFGLSPRGRGNPKVCRRASHIRGSIPAWAGEPALAMAARIILTVYPRVGGGTHSFSFDARLFWGLSPRGRGNPSAYQVNAGDVGSIPAWAGEPQCLSGQRW